MCVGDVLGAVYGAFIGCLKFFCAGIGLALVFSAGLVGLDLAADWPIVLIVIACIVALIWFLLAYCCGGLTDKDEEEFGYVARLFEPICDPKANLGISGTIEINGAKRNYSHELAASCQQIDTAMLDIFVVQIYHAIILLIIFTLLTVWFIPAGTALGYILGLLLGSFVITFITWFAVKISSRSLSRILINATEFKEEAFILMFQSGFGAIMISVASVYFFFVICFVLFKQGIVKDLPNDRNKGTILQMGVCCVGYALGIVVPAFVYREASSIFARGMFNSIDGLIKTDKNLNFNNPYISHPTKLLYVIQSLLANQMVNLLDASICLVVLTVSAFVILANSAEVIAEDMTYKSLLSPTLYLSVNILCSVLVQLFKTWFEEGEPATFTMLNCRLQVIITNIVSFLIFLTMPLATMLDAMSIKGDGHESLHNDISVTQISWSCIIGQLGNLALICYLEFLTSHGCRPVRNMASASVDRNPIQHVNYSHYLGGFGGLGAVVIMAMVVISVYALAGFVGFMGAACGFLINLLIYVPIMYVGVMAADAYKLCCMGIVNEIVSDRLYKIGWAARNYTIYVRVTTAGGAFLLALCFMGSCMFFFQKDPNIFVNGAGLYGIILGMGLTYGIRGITIAAVIYISKTYVSSTINIRFQDLNVYKSGIAVEVAQDDTLHDFVRTKLWHTMKFIYSIFITLTILLLINGYLFGYQATIGVMIGFIIATFLFMVHSLISGSSLKNARYFKEFSQKSQQSQKRDQIYDNYVNGDIMGTVIEESTAVPLIVYLLYIVLLVCACHELFAMEGDIFQ